MAEVRVLTTDEVPATLLADVRRLMDLAFGDDPDEAFTDDDWEHAIGGQHVLVLDDDGSLLAHAAVVARTIWIDDQPFRTGYVEGVATDPEHANLGHGSLAVAEVNTLILDGYELGVLGTGRTSFYEWLGWYPWEGTAHVRDPDGRRPTPDDAEALMVLPFGPSQAIRLTAELSCAPRPGDDW